MTNSICIHNIDSTEKDIFAHAGDCEVDMLMSYLKDPLAEPGAWLLHLELAMPASSSLEASPTHRTDALTHSAGA
jgi:hypothetical protein